MRRGDVSHAALVESFSSPPPPPRRYIRMNWNTMSKMKTTSTMRFRTKSVSGIAGESINPTSKGVTIAVKSSATVVTKSHLSINQPYGCSR